MFNKRRQYLPELLVFGGIFLLQFALFLSLTETLTPDSYEYIAADGFSWLGGSLHRYRLPLYPMLIDICNALSAQRGLTLVCVLQLFTHLLSIVVFYRAMQRIAPRRWLNLTVTVFYSLAPAIMSWQRTLLTESLSLSLTVFLFYALICYLQENRTRQLLLAASVLVLGCLLRAVFALYAGMVFGFLLLRLLFPGKGEKAERRTRRIHEAILLPIAAVPIALLLVYGAMFNAQYGAFTLSDSGTAQQLAVVLQQGYYTDAHDEELRELSREFMTSDTLNETYAKELDTYYAKLYNNGWTAAGFFRSDRVYPPRCYIMEHYDHARINAFVADAKQAHLQEYLTFLSNTTRARFYGLKTYREDSGMAAYEGVLLPQTFTLLHAIFIGVAELMLFVFLLIKRKQPFWLHLGLAGFLLATGLLAVFGTNADFARTAQTLLPFVYAAAGLWAHMLLDRLVKTQNAPCVNAL